MFAVKRPGRVLPVLMAGLFLAVGLMMRPQLVSAKYTPAVKKRMARKMFRKGMWAYRRKRFKVAVKFFLRAYEAWTRREILFNIALAYGKLGNKIKAVEYLRGFVEDASARDLRKIPKWLRSMELEVAVIKVVGPSGAVVFMDGKKLGTVPLRRVIMPGMHLFVVKKGEKRIAKRDWDVRPGLKRVWEVVEEKPKPRITPRVVERRGPTRVIYVPPPPAPKSKGIHWGAFTALTVVTVGLAAAGGATGAIAQDMHKKYKANPTAKRRKDGLLMRDLTNGLFGVAAVAGVTAVIVAIFTRWKDPKKERAETTPTLNVGVGSVSLTGRF